MINNPFLTDLDSRAAIKGSRDPLGIQSIWTRFGRHVVGNLSTVSNSVRDFTILILGYHFAEQVAETAGPGSELETFLKWEQLASYARSSVNGDWAFRGTERVHQNMASGDHVWISKSVSDQILSSQKLYGLWGLYTVPGRSSGFLDGDPTRLTPPARELVEKVYLKSLATHGFKDGKRIIQLLSQERGRIEVNGSDKKLLEAVASLLLWKFNALERDFYRYHLMHGGPQDCTEQRQRQLAELLEPKLTVGSFPWSTPAVIGFAKEAERRGTAWQSLGDKLRRIAAAETVLAPAAALFVHLLGCADGTTVDVLAKRLRQQWGTRATTVAINDLPALQTELGGVNTDTGKEWLAIAQAMSEGDYDNLIRMLLKRNKAVMQQRGGVGAWIEEENAKLRVRMGDEGGYLPDKKELLELWRFPYFLDSLCSVTNALKEPDHG